jgi:hypothetical protein
MTSILKNSGIYNVCQKTNCKDEVKVLEVSVHEAINTKK